MSSMGRQVGSKSRPGNLVFRCFGVSILNWWQLPNASAQILVIGPSVQARHDDLARPSRSMGAFESNGAHGMPDQLVESGLWVAPFKFRNLMPARSAVTNRKIATAMQEHPISTSNTISSSG